MAIADRITEAQVGPDLAVAAVVAGTLGLPCSCY